MSSIMLNVLQSSRREIDNLRGYYLNSYDLLFLFKTKHISITGPEQSLIPEQFKLKKLVTTYIWTYFGNMVLPLLFDYKEYQ